MKSLAVFAACLAAASLAAPAAAITRLAPSQPAFRAPMAAPPFFHRGHFGPFGRGDRELLWLGGYPGVYSAPEIVVAPRPAPIVNPPAPQVIYFSPVLGGAAPPPAPSGGPHIIYIGEHPTIHGPKVIYGVQ